MHFLEKVITALQNLENHKVLLEDPVGPNEGPWLVMDPVGGNSCDPRVPWYDFWCLECKIMAMIANFSCGPFAPPPPFLGFWDACLVRVKGTLSRLPENSNQQRFLMFPSRSGSLGGKFVWAFILLLLVLCIFQNSLHCTPWVIFLRIMGDFLLIQSINYVKSSLHFKCLFNIWVSFYGSNYRVSHNKVYLLDIPISQQC